MTFIAAPIRPEAVRLDHLWTTESIHRALAEFAPSPPIPPQRPPALRVRDQLSKMYEHFCATHSFLTLCGLLQVGKGGEQIPRSYFCTRAVEFRGAFSLRQRRRWTGP